MNIHNYIDANGQKPYSTLNYFPIPFTEISDMGSSLYTQGTYPVSLAPLGGNSIVILAQPCDL